MEEFAVMPSMRFLWASGPAAEFDNTCIDGMKKVIRVTICLAQLVNFRLIKQTFCYKEILGLKV